VESFGVADGLVLEIPADMHSLRLIIITLGLAFSGACTSEDPPKDPSAACCDPGTQPGVNGNPICVEGVTCCSDGTWACNEGDGSVTCSAPVCTAEE
jgi:hypothetical protein